MRVSLQHIGLRQAPHINILAASAAALLLARATLGGRLARHVAQRFRQYFCQDRAHRIPELHRRGVAGTEFYLAMADRQQQYGSKDGPGNGRDRDREDREGDGRTGLVTKTKPETKKPSLYKVLLLNDDYTPMEFVVHILERFFNKSREEATRIMLHVHQKGVGMCGVYTYEVAETKVTQVMDFSRQHGHPLQCTMEKE